MEVAAAVAASTYLQVGEVKDQAAGPVVAAAILEEVVMTVAMGVVVASVMVAGVVEEISVGAKLQLCPYEKWLR